MTDEPCHQQRVLHHIGDRCELIGDIATALELTTRQVGRATMALIQRGYIERVELGCFRLTPEGARAVETGVRIFSGSQGPISVIRKPLRNTQRQRAWRAMQIHREFTVPDIAMVVSRERPEAAYCNLQQYFRQLLTAGYLMRSARKVPGTAISSNGFNRFRLMKDTGPRAPVYSKKRGAFHDFNTGEDVPCSRS